MRSTQNFSADGVFFGGSIYLFLVMAIKRLDAR
jgi:hypothetical protein